MISFAALSLCQPKQARAYGASRRSQVVHSERLWLASPQTLACASERKRGRPVVRLRARCSVSSKAVLLRAVGAVAYTPTLDK